MNTVKTGFIRIRPCWLAWSFCSVLLLAGIQGKAQERASDAPGTGPAPTPSGRSPLAVSATAPSNITIGLLANDGSGPTVKSGLVATGLLQDANIQTISASGQTPTLNALLQYNAVLVWTNSAFSNPTATGDTLAAYVDAGGAVVIATYAFSISSGTSWWIGGRFETPGYMPFLPSTGLKSVSGVLDLSSAPPGHPIFDGLTNVTYFQNTNYTDPPLNADATLLAVDTQGNKVVAVNGAGTVAGISIFPGNNDISPSNPDVSRLFANALIFTAGGGFRITNKPYANVTPITVTGVAGDTAIVRVAVQVRDEGFVDAVIDTDRTFHLDNVTLLPDSNRVVAHGFTATDSLAAADTTYILLDQTPPSVVFGPEAAGITNIQATIFFDTDEPTDGFVAFGLTPEPGEERIAQRPSGIAIDTTNTVSDGKTDFDHRVILFDLLPDTTYYYQVIVVDRAGNKVGPVPVTPKSFRTRRAPDTTPPLVVEFPAAEGITNSGAIITAATDELAFAFVEVAEGDSTNEPFSVPGPETENLRHRIPLTDLNPDTDYFFRMFFIDPSENQTVTGFSRFRTKAGPDTIPPVIRKVSVLAATTERTVIGWETDEPATSEAELTFLGESMSAKVITALESAPIIGTDSELVRRHQILFTNLQAGPYAFLVRSQDQSGNKAESRRSTFLIAPPDTIPPVLVSPVATIYNGGYLICLGFRTDEPTIARVDMAPEDDLTDVRSFYSPEFRIFHVIAITNLETGRVYRFMLTLTDASGNTTVFPENGLSSKVLAGLRETKMLFKVLQGPVGRFTTNNQPDTQAPVILGGPTIVAQSSNALTISWTTDELSNSVIEYGTGGFDLVESSADFVTSHQVTLANLSPGTTYRYRISSRDGLGNGPTLGPLPALSATGATSQQPDISPPVISDVAEGAVTDTRAIITWKTNEISDSFVEFDTTATGFSQVLGTTDLVTDHSVTLTNLRPGGTYYYRVRSTDVHGNGPSFGPDGMFTTSLTPDGTAPAFSGISVRPGYRSVQVSWTTDELANSFVEVVNSADDTLTIATTDLVTAHRLTVADTTFLPAGANDFTAILGSTDPSGNTGVSAGQAFTTLDSPDTTAPAAPAGLTAREGSGAVALQWRRNTEPDFNGYIVYRATGADTVQVQYGITDTVYLDQSVVNDSSYTYFLQALDAAIPTPNLSAFSSSAAATPAAASAPSAPAPGAPANGDTVSLKPVLVVSNAAPGTSGGTLTYTFAVYADSALTQLVASISGIPEGTSGNPTHWQVINPAIIDSVVLQNGATYWWQSRANDGTFDGAWSPLRRFVASSSKPTGIEEDMTANLPKTYALSQNFPNPFNPATQISYALPKPGLVTLTVYNILGQQVRTLIDDSPHEAGVHVATWNGRNQADRQTGSGVYFYRIEVRDPAGRQSVFVQTKKMLLVK